MSIFIPGSVASIGIIVASKQIERIDHAIRAIEAALGTLLRLIVDHIVGSISLTVLLATIALLSFISLPYADDDQPKPSPFASAVITDTATTTTTATISTAQPKALPSPSLPANATSPSPAASPTASPPIDMICASNAGYGRIDGTGSSDIPADAYTSTDRYASRPALRSLVRQIYPQAEVEISPPDCKDERLIVSTARLKDSAHANEIVFRKSGAQQWPVGEVWVLLSASNTAGYPANDSIGTITTNFREANQAEDSARTVKLVLGKNIADWTFREQLIAGSGELGQTLTDFDASDPNVMRILSDQELDGSTNIVGRAAQLLAVRAAVLPEGASLREVRIRPTGADQALDILSVAVVPAGLSRQEAVVIEKSTPICLSRAKSYTEIWSLRTFGEDVALPEKTYNIEPGCNDLSDAGKVELPDLARGVEFYFNNILATTPAGDSPASNRNARVTLDLTDDIRATHLYLIMTARNLCVAEAEIIGQISINEQENSPPYDLSAGRNIRQGRTNVSLSECDSGATALSMLKPEEQPDQRIIGVSGVPVRAKPNDRTEFKPAELWLDLIKVKLPSHGQQITITISNNPNGPQTEDEPFFTLYGAALVREQP